MLSPTGVSVEPHTSNPTWGAGGEPPTPCPGPASSPGSGWAAGQALCNQDVAEGRAEERTWGQELHQGGGQSSEFPGSVWPFPSGKVQEIWAGSPITASHQPLSGHTSRYQRPELQRIGTLP